MFHLYEDNAGVLRLYIFDREGVATHCFQFAGDDDLKRCLITERDSNVDDWSCLDRPSDLYACESGNLIADYDGFILHTCRWVCGLAGVIVIGYIDDNNFACAI